MTLTFVTNLVHHHQLPLADEFYNILGDNYRYIATEALPEWLIEGGYNPNLDRPYIIRTYNSEYELRKARRLIDESDVVIIGSAPASWVYRRKKENKVTFHYNERWLRFGAWRKFMPKSLYMIWKNHFQFRNHRTYMLCASAFTSKDVHTFFCYPQKCFKWGYFTKVDENFDVETLNTSASTSDFINIMWCARFLKLKHPELPILLAFRLKKSGYNFHIDMYGNGEQLEKTKELITKYSVDDCVSLCGNLPNDEILKEMRKHAIFLFTSDRNEGWGAVLNESMSNGCIPVASDAIGSVPYLIKDRLNGLVFRSCSIDSLETAVRYLLDNPCKIDNMRKAAVYTMRKMWSPKVAAKNFIELANLALENNVCAYQKEDGPASWQV